MALGHLVPGPWMETDRSVSPMLAVCLWPPWLSSLPQGLLGPFITFWPLCPPLYTTAQTGLLYRVTMKERNLCGGASVGNTKTICLCSILFLKLRMAFSNDTLKMLSLFSSNFSLQNSTKGAVLERDSQCLSNFRSVCWTTLSFSFLIYYLGCQLKKTLTLLLARQLGHMCPADLFQKHWGIVWIQWPWALRTQPSIHDFEYEYDCFPPQKTFYLLF